jgi:hypothetical protein
MTFIVPNDSGSLAHERQAQLDQHDFSILARAHETTGVVTGCGVTAQVTPDMTVAVASGSIRWQGGSVVNVSAVSSLTIGSADPTNPRFDLVVVNNSGTVSVLAGTASTNPVFPDVTAGSYIALAAVYVPAADTAISSNQIVDKRIFLAPVVSAPTTPRARFTTASISYTENGVRVIDWASGTTNYDSASLVQSANDRFTIPTGAGGIYLITLDGACSLKDSTNSSGMEHSCRIRVNGTNISGNGYSIASAGTKQASLRLNASVVKELSVGDNVDGTVYLSTSDASGTEAYTFVMTITKIAETV